MFYKRVVVYIPDEEMYKALKHKLVDDGLTLNSLMLELIRQYLDGDNEKPATVDTSVRELQLQEIVNIQQELIGQLEEQIDKLKARKGFGGWLSPWQGRKAVSD